MSQMIGKILGNRYQIIEKIGEGGMANVYKAKCLLLNRFVAVKVLKPELVSDDEFVQKFEKESQAAASLSNPNIVNIYDVGKDGEVRYIVMELVRGVTLKKYIKGHDGYIPNDEIIEIAKQIALGLEHAHANRIIHRDIKPHNILINEDGIVKVADFGIARAVTSSTIVTPKEAIGSVHYSSPEQARGGFVDEKSDIYSLGILLYELATKKLPFDGDVPVSVAMKHIKEKVVNPSQVNPEIGKGLESVILKAIQKEPANRYQTARDLIDDLDKLSKNPDLNVPFYVHAEDSPTMIIPNVKGMEFDEKPKEKKSKVGVALAVIAALIAAVLLIGAFTLSSIMDRMKPKVVVMPELEGVTYTDAVETLHGLSLNINVKDYVFDSNIEKNHIVRQSQAAGEELKEGFTVDVIVSNGPELVKVPNLMQKDVSEAKLILDNKSLNVGEINYEYSDLPSGLVAKQTPSAGSDAKKGENVNLVVSQGKPIETVLVPNLLGKSLPQVKSALSSVSLTLGNVTYNFSDTYEKDAVMIQSISSGTEVEEKTSVSVVISKGSENGEAVEGTDGDTTGDGGTETEVPVDTDLVEKTYIIPLNFASQKEVVRVEMIQNGVTTTVYEKEHDKSEENVRVVVSGTGEATVNFYFGSLQVKSMKVSFN